MRTQLSVIQLHQSILCAIHDASRPPPAARRRRAARAAVPLVPDAGGGGGDVVAAVGGDEGRAGPVRLDAAALRGPLLGVPDAGEDVRGLARRERHPARGVVPEHPDRGAVDVEDDVVRVPEDGVGVEVRRRVEPQPSGSRPPSPPRKMLVCRRYGSPLALPRNSKSTSS